MRYGFPKNPIVKKPSQTNSKDKKSLHIQQVFLHWFKKCKMTNMHTTSSMDFRQSKCEVGASWLWRVMAWSHSNKQTNKQTSILIYRCLRFQKLTSKLDYTTCWPSPQKLCCHFMKIPFSQANPRIWLKNKAMYATTSLF